MLYKLKLNCLIFFYQSKQLTEYIYTDIYCKLLKCIGHRLRVRMNIILFVQKHSQASQQFDVAHKL